MTQDMAAMINAARRRWRGRGKNDRNCAAWSFKNAEFCKKLKNPTLWFTPKAIIFEEHWPSSLTPDQMFVSYLTLCNKPEDHKFGLIATVLGKDVFVKSLHVRKQKICVSLAIKWMARGIFKYFLWLFFSFSKSLFLCRCWFITNSTKE